MILHTENGVQIRGDLIKSATARSDMAPVPVTLEAEIRVLDDAAKALLAVGKKIQLAGGDWLTIVKSSYGEGLQVQGAHKMAAVKIVALLDACLPVTYVRQRAVIKESATLLQIYRACGASLQAVDADLPVDRFTCLVGEAPSFHLARALQEQGGVVRWKDGRLKFFRLQDLFKQQAAISLNKDAFEDTDSGFLERHEIPFFFSLNVAGAAVLGNQSKARKARFSPFKNQQQLNNMTRCLVTKKSIRVMFDYRLGAGDVVEVDGVGALVVVTAAHVFQSGTDGDAADQYSRLWLAKLEN